jgi:hypothetical protein
MTYLRHAIEGMDANTTRAELVTSAHPGRTDRVLAVKR